MGYPVLKLFWVRLKDYMALEPVTVWFRRLIRTFEKSKRVSQERSNSQSIKKGVHLLVYIYSKISRRYQHHALHLVNFSRVKNLNSSKIKFTVTFCCTLFTDLLLHFLFHDKETHLPLIAPDRTGSSFPSYLHHRNSSHLDLVSSRSLFHET